MRSSSLVFASYLLGWLSGLSLAAPATFQSLTGLELETHVVLGSEERTDSRDVGDRLYYDSEEVANSTATGGRWSTRSTVRPRIIDPILKPKVQTAIDRLTGRKLFFWTGSLRPASGEKDFVMHRAAEIAKQRGGLTIDQGLTGLNMPGFNNMTPDDRDLWAWASAEWAETASGDVFVIYGEVVRNNNTFERVELPRLKLNKKVKRVLRINAHRVGADDPIQIWPTCPDFGPKIPKCAPSTRLYYGAAQKPRITATTTAAKDGAAKVGASGTAPGIRGACDYMIEPAWVKGLMQKAGTCSTDTKFNGQIQTLLASNKNVNKFQSRLAPMKRSALPADASIPSIGKFRSSPLDALVAINYIEKTLVSSRAVATQLDTMVKTATGTALGANTEWNKRMNALKPIRVALVALVNKEAARLKKQADAAKARANACGAAPAPGGKPRRSLASNMSPARLSSLMARVVRAPRSGPKAPAAPSCPLKGATPKKVVPASKAPVKAAPAKRPRTPAKRPAPRKPSPAKRAVKRPATRARRTPGTQKPRKRTTPKRKPRAVPKPTRRPKGTPRRRKGRK